MSKVKLYKVTTVMPTTTPLTKRERRRLQVHRSSQQSLSISEPYSRKIVG